VEVEGERKDSLLPALARLASCIARILSLWSGGMSIFLYENEPAKWAKEEEAEELVELIPFPIVNHFSYLLSKK
jgi:hypothetical protein